MPRLLPLVVFCSVVQGPVGPVLSAQTPDSLPPGSIAPGVIQSGSMERYQLDESVVFSYRASQYRPRRPGIDLGVGVFPRYLASGLVAVTLDAGLAQAVPVGSALLFLRGGGGALLLAGNGYGGLAPALQAGLALVVPLDRRTGVRLDLGEHWYFFDHEAERRWSIGIGFAVLPRSR
jgi:hypothetical protein